MQLTPRLQAIANQIPHGARVADIGTDHAYIPVYLLLNRIAGHVIASDSRKGPLKAAEETMNLFNLGNVADLRLGDGLDVLNPADDFNVVVIAGMGGETICSILDRGQDKLGPDIRLVLQPMTEQGLVRKWLVDNDWAIVEEDIALEDRKYYEIIAAVPGNADTIDDSRMLDIGPLLLKRKHPLLKPMLEQRLKRLSRAASRASGSQSATARSRAAELRSRRDFIREVLTWL